MTKLVSLSLENCGHYVCVNKIFKKKLSWERNIRLYNTVSCITRYIENSFLLWCVREWDLDG